MDSIISELQKKDTIQSYKNKKLEAEKVSYLYSYSEKKQEKISDCSITLWRENWQHVSTEEKKEKYSSNNCQLRFCPVCSWRKALKSSAVLYSNLSDFKNVTFLFLTLTLKNCQLEDLKDTLKHLSESFIRLKRKDEWKKIVKGYIRALEVTISDDGSIHPHFHILIQVPKSYGKNSGYYLTQSQLTDIWQDCLNVDYKPIIDIRNIKSKNNNENSLIAAVCETVKYTLKSSDLLKMNEDSFPLLDLSMKGIKTLNCGGSLLHCLKVIKKDELLEDDEWVLIGRELFKWQNGDYTYVR